MLDSYVKARKNTSVEPEFYAGNNMFKVTLPSLIFHEECEEYVADNVPYTKVLLLLHLSIP